MNENQFNVGEQAPCDIVAGAKDPNVTAGITDQTPVQQLGGTPGVRTQEWLAKVMGVAEHTSGSMIVDS